MLKRSPQHGYELKSHIEQEMGDWTSIAFGSIYFALKKLTEEGFIRQIGQEQHGNRPSRIIYEITPPGEKEFQRLLKKTWTDQNRQYFPFDIGLFFLKDLNEDTRLQLIQNKINEAETSIKYLKSHEKTEMASPHMPAEASAIFSHSLYHLKAELAWLREIEQKMKEGKY